MRRLMYLILAAVLGTLGLTACSSNSSPVPTPTVSHAQITPASAAFNDVPDELQRAIPQATFHTATYSPGSFGGDVTFKSAPGFEGGYDARLEQSAPAGRWKDLTKVATKRFKVKGLDGVFYDETYSGRPRVYVHRSVGGKEYVALLLLDWPKNLPGHDTALTKSAEVLATALLSIK